MFSSLVSVEPQYGQRKTALCSWTSFGRRRLARGRRREAGRAQLLAAFRRDPVGRPRVVEDDLDVGLGAELLDRSPSSASRITSSAGQPRNVGVNSTWTRSPSTWTSRTTPRSTSEITGISGSSTSASAAQTASAVTTSPPGPSGAPRSSPPRAPASRRRARRARPASHSGSSKRSASVRALLGLDEPERVGPELLERLAEARLVAQPLAPHLARASGGTPPRGRSSRRGRRPPRRPSAFSASSRSSSAAS